RDLSNRTQADLGVAFDYFEHPKAVWRLVRRVTDMGHTYDIQETKNPAAMTLADLAERAQSYVAKYLADAVFQHFVSLFEGFLFELLRLWLAASPAGIPNKDKKPVDLATVIDAADREAIIEVVIERELNALKYERPKS